MTEFAVNEVGAKGLAWVKLTEEGPVGGIAKFITEEDMYLFLLSLIVFLVLYVLILLFFVLF